MKQRCLCVGEILILVTKVHDSPSSLNMGIPILLCQEHGKPPTFFQRIPMGGGLLKKKGTGCLMNTDINMLLYIYTHVKLRSNLGKLRFSYFLQLEAGKGKHLYSNTSPLCNFLPFNASMMYPILLFKILSN